MVTEGMDGTQGPRWSHVLLQSHQQAVQLGKTRRPEIQGRGQNLLPVCLVIFEEKVKAKGLSFVLLES